jgi:hypothetical protein
MRLAGLVIEKFGDRRFRHSAGAGAGYREAGREERRVTGILRHVVAIEPAQKAESADKLEAALTDYETDKKKLEAGGDSSRQPTTRSAG